MVRALDLQLMVMSSNPCNMPSRIFIFFTVETVKSAEPHHYAKFYRNRWNRGQDIAIFGFFKMMVAVILDF